MHDLPLARSTRLLVEELDGDLLVYDQDADTAHALTDQVARVWQCCDGTATAEDIARDLALDDATVARALDDLAGCKLLLEPIALTGYSRRDAVKRAMKVGAAAASAPLIYSMAIGPASAMATPVACGQIACGGPGIGNGAATNFCRAQPACQTTGGASNATCVGNTTGPSGTPGLCQFN